MARTSQSSLWFLPLVGGAEVVARTDPSLVTVPDDLLAGNLPSVPPWLRSGLLLWLDTSAASTTKVFPDNTIYRWISRVGDGKFASAPTATLRPTLIDGPVVTFEDP